jgi:hypothetical protein
LAAANRRMKIARDRSPQLLNFDSHYRSGLYRFESFRHSCRVHPQ